ncbi:MULTISPECIES: hypothetical protein [Actinoalloteichus]|uniref:hypothetical protein n=1 Tax=Actinoalloteichus TaxID=65496 RepID=UPI0012F72703|nr:MULTISPECIES: hypothetical protein [Actinoalloteichus]
MRAALMTGGLLIAGPGMASAEIEPPVTETVSGPLECCPERPAESARSESSGFFTGFLVPSTAPSAGATAEVPGSETRSTAALPRTSGSPDLPVQQESRNTMTMPAADDAALPTYDQPRYSQHREIAEYWDVWADVNSSTRTLSAEALDRLPAGPLFHGLHRVMTGQILTEPVQSAHRVVDPTAVTAEFSLGELNGRLHQAKTDASNVGPKLAVPTSPSVLDASVTAELPRITELTKDADTAQDGEFATTAESSHTARSTDQVQVPGYTESVLPDGSMLRLASVPTEVIRASLSRGPLPSAPTAEDVDPLAVWGEFLPGAGELPRIPELTAVVRSAALSPASVLPEMGRLGGLGVAVPLPVALPAPGSESAGSDVAAGSEVESAAFQRVEGDDRPTVELPRVWAIAEDPADLPMLPAIQSKSWGLLGATDLPEIPELADAFGAVSLSDPAVVMVSLPTPTAQGAGTTAEHGVVVVSLPASTTSTDAAGADAPQADVSEAGVTEPRVLVAAEQRADDEQAEPLPQGASTAAVAGGSVARQRGLEGLGLGGGLPLDGPTGSLQFDALNDMNGLPLLGRPEVPALSTLDTAVLLRAVTSEETGDLAARN